MDKVDGIFATVIVILPSKYSGGAAHLTHGGSSAVYDYGPRSQHYTTVLSWYSDVTHEIKPIASGYQLALSYNVIHTSQSPCPSLSPNVDFMQKLRRVMSIWEQDEGGLTPDKVFYLLTHTYSEASLKASALKGTDAHTVALLGNLAEDMGFGLGLAIVECCMRGTATNIRYYKSD